MLTPEEIEATRAWRRMALKDAEYDRICAVLGRRPNFTELGMFAVLWSEHCAYKHSRRALGLLPTEGEQVLQGPGENAGVVDIGDGLACAFKVETHNHPSAVEPYQGAATGVGGIVRDILAMGARPTCLLNSLRFGDIGADARSRFLFSGVVAGIAGYGNCIGVPTVGGEVLFEDSYRGNPLVNVVCAGIVPHGDLMRGRAAGAGNAVMLVGAGTGRDGIHGATFASEELTAASESRRPAVQVGDPFMEKLLIEACLQSLETGHVVGLQDFGAAGLTGVCAETADRAGTGMSIAVDLVPRREPGMNSYEVMLSESQERMLVIVEQGHEDEVAEVFSRWGLVSTVIGRVTDDGLLRVHEDGRPVASVPVRALVSEAPVYDPEMRRPAYLDEVVLDPATVPDLEPEQAAAALEKLLSSPAIASKEVVWRQYDHMVQTNTAVLPGSDAAVLRVRGTRRGIALSTDGNGRYCYLDPYTGGAAAVAEAARNVSCAGARPLGLTNCLNFGNPEKPGIYWQFHHAVRGMAAACRALGIPVTGGNVSFYNETEGEPIYPTPVVGVVGLLEDVAGRCVQAFSAPGDAVYLLGETKDEIGGSEFLKVWHGRIAGPPPSLDLEAEGRLQQVVRLAVASGMARSAHDCSDGGLAVALAECCCPTPASTRRGPGPGEPLGCEVTLPGSGLRLDAALFGESHSRAVISVPPGRAADLEEAAGAHGVPCHRLGTVGGDRLRIRLAGAARPLVDVELSWMDRAWREAIPCLLG